MTTEPNAAAPAQGTPGAPSMSPEQIANHRAYWVSLGLPGEQFDATVNGAPSPAPSQWTAADAAAAGSAGPRWTDQQAAGMAEALIAAGMDPARVRAAALADGYEIEDKRSPEQVTHDRDWGFDRQYDPEAYRIDYMPALAREAAPVDPAELAKFDADARQFLAGMQIDPTVGAGLVERAQWVTQATANMSAVERELFKLEQRAIAERRAGRPEGLAENVRLAGVAIRQAGRNDFWLRFVEGKAADDAWIIETLANHGRKLEQWEAARPKR